MFYSSYDPNVIADGEFEFIKENWRDHFDEKPTDDEIWRRVWEDYDLYSIHWDDLITESDEELKDFNGCWLVYDHRRDIESDLYADNILDIAHKLWHNNGIDNLEIEINDVERWVRVIIDHCEYFLKEAEECERCHGMYEKAKMVTSTINEFVSLMGYVSVCEPCSDGCKCDYEYETLEQI